MDWHIGGAARDGHALTPERMRAYGRILAALAALGIVFFVVQQIWQAAHDPAGRPGATDYASFWAASHLALLGAPASAYNRSAIAAVEHGAASFDAKSYLAFFYPPTCLLLYLPLALIAYLPSLLLFQAGFSAIFARTLRRLLPQRWALLPILAMPAGLMNWFDGQNGLLSASCFAGALLLESRPGLAGACLGVLAYKPQLAICVPVALLAARRFRALVTCGGTAVGLGVASWLAFGSVTWRAFAANAAYARDALENHAEDWEKQLSLFTAVRLLHGGLALAYAAEIAGALAALAALAILARKRPGAPAETAALVAASMLCTPHLMDYDLACLGLPLAWVVSRAQCNGWRPWEKSVALAVFVAPLVLRMINVHLGLPLAPFLLAALLAIVFARISRNERSKEALVF